MPSAKLQGKFLQILIGLTIKAGWPLHFSRLETIR